MMWSKEWKRPNWRNPAEYPDLKDNLHQWYWQFLRRREDYQAAFWEHAQETYDTCIELKESGFEPYQDGEILTPDSPGFRATIPSCWEIFYTTICPNPAEDSLSDFFYSGRKTISMVYGDLGKGGANRHRRWTQSKEIVTRLELNEVFVKFDLDRPINAQLSQAKEMLQQRQNYKLHKETGNEKNKLPQVRRHTDKWINYLRALDARHSGATLEEIGLIIPLKNPASVHEYDHHAEKDDLSRKGQSLLDSAKELQFNFPF